MAKTQRVIIVTGGATGIGLGISRVLAEQGALIATVQAHLNEAEAGATKIPGAMGFAADVRSNSEVVAMVQNVVATFGRVDGLVNNAAVTGAGALAAFLEMSEEQAERIVDTNLNGTIWCSQAVAKQMVRQGTGGAIVNIASVGAFAGQDHAAVYCATKGGQVALTKALALELASAGIRVNAVAPGDILNGKNEQVTAEIAKAGGRKEFIRSTPLGRRGVPQDIGEAVAFLLSDAASFITGSTLVVDGGFLSY